MQHRVVYLAGYERRHVVLVDGQILHDDDAPPSPAVWLDVMREVSPSTFVLFRSGDNRTIDLDIAQEQSKWMHKL